MSFLAAADTLAGFSMFSSTQRMPGFAWATSVRGPARRPAMITRLPRLWRASATPRPMPDPPPVMKIVLPVSFMRLLLDVVFLVVLRHQPGALLGPGFRPRPFRLLIESPWSPAFPT